LPKIVISVNKFQKLRRDCSVQIRKTPNLGDTAEQKFSYFSCDKQSSHALQLNISSFHVLQKLYKQAWRPRWFAWGLVGFADFADGYYTTIDHQKVIDVLFSKRTMGECFYTVYLSWIGNSVIVFVLVVIAVLAWKRGLTRHRKTWKQPPRSARK
jgi:hypothetical protein